MTWPHIKPASIFKITSHNVLAHFLCSLGSYLYVASCIVPRLCLGLVQTTDLVVVSWIEHVVTRFTLIFILATKLICFRCAVGYMGYPSCQRCNCSVEGSTNVDPCVTPCVCKVHPPPPLAHTHRNNGLYFVSAFKALSSLSAPH